MKNLKVKLILCASFLAIVGLLSYGVFLIRDFKQIDLSNVQTLKSYDELYKVMKSKKGDQSKNLLMENSRDTYATNSAEKGSSDYSKTNIQVSGVDEADIVKTDGNYIYALSSDYLNIIEAKDGEMTVTSKIKSQANSDEGSSNYQEIYIKDNKLIVIKNSFKYFNNTQEDIYRSYIGGTQEVSVVIFDVTIKSKPVKINELSQSGNYVSSRLVDNYLYVTTNYYVNNNFVKTDEKTFVPLITSKDSKAIAIDDIIIAPNPTSNSFVTITGMDINNPSEYKSSKAVLGTSSNIYADTDNLYVATTENSWYSNYSETNLIKFSMNKGILKLVATGSVKGTILNQFSMDEYDDYFRIVTTYYDYNLFGIDDIIAPGEEEEDTTKNNLFVLDKDLKMVSKIEGLAKGERIYSVRFDGEIVYFVTFKQIDPLFVVDLSNPSTPTIKTELKIPGFSEYLHVFNDKYLFGLGKETNEDGRVTNLKISMYDIQNKSDVTEKYKTIIGNENSWTEASYNHKAVLVSSTKNIIAFPMDDLYVVYKFTEDVGFEKIGEIDYNTEEDYYYYSGNTRGLYINDYLYVVNYQDIRTINLTTLTHGNVLELIPSNNVYDSIKDY